MAYLLIPERHQNGAWHIHGLLAGIPMEDVTPFTWADVRAGRCPAKLVQGGYWNWPRFAGKYGFCSLGRVRSQERVAAYVAKYITKDLVRVAAEAGSTPQSGLGRQSSCRPAGCPAALADDPAGLPRAGRPAGFGKIR